MSSGIRIEELRARGGVAQTIIHPFSWISPSAQIGAGTVVFGGVVVNANSRIGENCILNTSCSVDHDGNIASHVHLCPGVRLAGNVMIAERGQSIRVIVPHVLLIADADVGCLQ